MQIEKGKLYAVITGDIVGSSQLDEKTRRSLFDVMRTVGKESADWLGTNVMPLPLDIFGGVATSRTPASPGVRKPRRSIPMTLSAMRNAGLRLTPFTT